MAKQPTFKLYRICDRTTGKAFAGYATRVQPYFNAQGTFFRNPETIRKHLKSITHEHVWKKNPNSSYGGWYILGSEIPNRYKDFYVECYSVLQLKLDTKEASEYMGKK